MNQIVKQMAAVPLLCLLLMSCTQTLPNSVSHLKSFATPQSVAKSPKSVTGNVEQNKQQTIAERQRSFVNQQIATQQNFIKEQLEKQTASAQALKISRSATIAKATGRDKTSKPQPASVTSATRSAGIITLNAPWKCVPSGLKRVIVDVSNKFGPVTVNSTHRSRSKNRKIGGAQQSYHLGCKAVDFRVEGNTSAVLKYLRAHPQVGGVKRYRSGYFHIDNGPKRSWR